MLKNIDTSMVKEERGLVLDNPAWWHAMRRVLVFRQGVKQLFAEELELITATYPRVNFTIGLDGMGL